MGTAPSSPSSLSAVATATDSGGTFSTLKEGKGKGPDKGGDAPAKGGDAPAPATGTTPGKDDGEDTGDDSGPGHNQTQIEGFTTSVTGTCPNLTIVINAQTVKTDLKTDFQRAECTHIADPKAVAGLHLHIAATMKAGTLTATSVRMQGPKPDGDDTDDDAAPATGTAPKV